MRTPSEAAQVLALQGVSKGFGEGRARVDVLRDVDFALAEGELVAIVGFSGSGKTTLISLMAGLLSPDSGTVTMDGAPIRGPGPERGVVFQSYALLPWQTALANVRLAVDAVHPEWPRARRREEAERNLALVNLSAARGKRPHELSGGMRQRVAVARALAMDPRILLLDEPLGALDALTRGSLQREIERIWQASRKSVVLVTNDVDEAILLADRILPLTPGPGARLGPEFRVPLQRPRERAALQRDPTFRKLRSEVTGYLLALAADRHREAPEAGLIPPLPALDPVDLRPGRRGTP
ncbi:MAG: ABC transporter ATP-binding protein [Myxococcota bacterium]